MVLTTTVNTFWVAANVMFDLGTGETKQILLLVNRVEIALTAFDCVCRTKF
jgi:hypothetical protein